MEQKINEMYAHGIPDVILDYEDYIYPYMGVSDDTNSYISKLLIDKNTGKKYVLVSIEWQNNSLEFVLPNGVIVRQKGDHETFPYLRKEFLKRKNQILKDAEGYGTCVK